MKTTFQAAGLICAGLACTAFANGENLESEVDVSGLSFTDGLGSILNDRVSLYAWKWGTVHKIGWDVSIMTNTHDSFLSDAWMRLTGDGGETVYDVQFAPEHHSPGSLNFSTGGLVPMESLIGVIGILIRGDPELQIEFYDSNDNLLHMPDATFLPGSSITISYVPSPGSAGMFLLTSLHTTRRKRH